MHARTVALVVLSLAACGPSAGHGSGGGDGSEGGTADGGDGGEASTGTSDETAGVDVASCEEIAACADEVCEIWGYLDLPIYQADYEFLLGCTRIKCGATDHRSQYRALSHAWGVKACDTPLPVPSYPVSCEGVATCIDANCPLSDFDGGAGEYVEDPEWYYTKECAFECGAADDNSAMTAISVAWGIPDSECRW